MKISHTIFVQLQEKVILPKSQALDFIRIILPLLIFSQMQKSRSVTEQARVTRDNVIITQIPIIFSLHRSQ